MRWVSLDLVVCHRKSRMTSDGTVTRKNHSQLSGAPSFSELGFGLAEEPNRRVGSLYLCCIDDRRIPVTKMLSLPLEAREQEATVQTSCFLTEVVMWIASIETVHQAAPEFSACVGKAPSLMNT